MRSAIEYELRPNVDDSVLLFTHKNISIINDRGGFSGSRSSHIDRTFSVYRDHIFHAHLTSPEIHTFYNPLFQPMLFT